MTFPPAEHYDQASVLLSLLARGLQRHGELATQRSLGDRTRYIGASDIGRALGCMRATVAGKLLPTPQTGDHLDEIQAALRRQLTLQRGHCFEEMVDQALRAQDLAMVRQLEIDIHHQGTPITAHLDFVLVSQSPVPTVRILECKSSTRLPETLYTSYETQVYGQVGFLAAAWNSKAFSLRDDAGQLLHARLTFPELCRKHLKITVPASPAQVDLQAWVLSLSMTDAKAFGPYLPHPAMLELCLKTASQIWMYLKDCRKDQRAFRHLPTAAGCHPLCGHCDWNADCPNFVGLEHPEWEADLAKLASLKTRRKHLDAEIDVREQALKAAYATAKAQGQWITAASYRFKVAQQSGRRQLDKTKLRLALLERTGSEDATDQLLARCETVGNPFERLTVSRVNRPMTTSLPGHQSSCHT